jgi:maleate isomerase
MLGWRGMVGLIVPSNNNVIMPELYSALPKGVTVYETRMRVEGNLTFEAVRKMSEDAAAAADLLRQTGVDFVCYCCMSSTIVKGWEWERDLLAKLAKNAPKGIASANSALKDALVTIGARRLALVTPYPESINALLPAFLRSGGFEVKSMVGTPVHDVSAVRWLSLGQVYRAARSLDLADVDAVCLLATDVQTFPIIDALEHDLGVPVLTSNQALLWSSLRALRIDAPIDGLGILLRRLTRTSDAESAEQDM